VLNAGHAYPLFYDTLFADLREEITQICQSTRERRLGVGREDGTNPGVSWGGFGSLDTMPPFFPKLWRRLEGYTFDGEFRDDLLFVLPDIRFTGLDNVVAIEDDAPALDGSARILGFLILRAFVEDLLR